jgi:hypothetical protein
MKLFILRHSMLRVLESQLRGAYAAPKNRFQILDEKSLHPFVTKVNIVLACYILHNKISVLGLMSLSRKRVMLSCLVNYPFG